jgi:hypothetical protein
MKTVQWLELYIKSYSGIFEEEISKLVSAIEKNPEAASKINPILKRLIQQLTELNKKFEEKQKSA